MDRSTLALRTAGMRRFLPTGRQLEDLDFQARHRLLTTILALHLPVLVIVGLVTGHGVAPTLGTALAVGLLLAAALAPGPRRRRSLSASLGLLSCSALLVHFAHGASEAHFHYFVAVALIALYQDWAVYALAFTFVVLEHVLLGAFDPADLYDHHGNVWLLAAVHAGFIAALCFAQLTFWHFLEQSRMREEHYRRKLYAGQESLVAHMQETERLRSDLLGTVSHEFRTPLTAIQVSAMTLRRRRDRLSPAQVDDILDAQLGHGRRLSRLLENMLTAAGTLTLDEDAVTDTRDVVAAAIRDLPEEPRSRVVVDLPRELPARTERRALLQAVTNILDNALVHSVPGTPVTVAGARIGNEVVMRCINAGPALDEGTIRRLFDPFTQADGSPTRRREGAGMGLHVARRLMEAHGGRLQMTARDGEVVVEIALRAAGERGDRPATGSGTARFEAAPDGSTDPARA